MKKKTLVAVIGLVLGICFSFSPAAASLKTADLRNDPGGFRGIEWGKPLSSFEKMVPYKVTPYTNEFYHWRIDGFGYADRFFDDDWKKPLIDGKRENFIREGESLFFHKVPLIRIVYSFSNGKLSEVTLLFKGDENYLAMEKLTEQLFGPTTVLKCPPVLGAVGRLQTDRFWQGKKTWIQLRWDHLLFTDKTFGFLQFRSRANL
ncbi:MAG TPA: hypothetical protein PLY83_04505 [Synergistales bacterium]|nr:hypothetical protein [Synergistales bacterium]